jgi:hypothetical protein
MTGPSESVAGLTQLKPGSVGVSVVVGDGVGKAFLVVVGVGVEPAM